MQNNKKRCLITGITGQSGSYLAELLLSKEYEIFGLVRRHAIENLDNSNIGHLLNDVKLFYGDMTDPVSIQNAIIRSNPHEIYNMAAQSSVPVSFENPAYTADCVGLGVLHLLEAARMHCPSARILTCGSSEMFGNSIDEDGFQRASTPMRPANPYATAKVFGFNTACNYRNAYKMFIVNSIGNNQESPRRGANFVTSKVIREAVKISKGLATELKLGNLDAARDWNHAKDVIFGMYLMMQHHTPDDWVISSGEGRTVRDLCECVFTKLGLNYKDYVKVDQQFIRPEETRYLRGDSSKIREVLGWKPEYTFSTLIDEMIAHYQKLLA